MSVVCNHCNKRIDKKKMIKRKNKHGAIFYLNKETEKNVEDIIKYHCFIGVYIICSCETLITCGG